MTRAGSVYRGRWGVGMNVEGMACTRTLARLLCVSDGRRPRAYLYHGNRNVVVFQPRGCHSSRHSATTRRATWAAIPARSSPAKGGWLPRMAHGQEFRATTRRPGSISRTGGAIPLRGVHIRARTHQRHTHAGGDASLFLQDWSTNASTFRALIVPGQYVGTFHSDDYISRTCVDTATVARMPLSLSRKRARSLNRRWCVVACKHAEVIHAA